MRCESDAIYANWMFCVLFTAHWLTVDGVQPTVVENPTPVTKTTLQQESTEPTVKSELTNKRKPSSEPGKSKQKLRTREKVQLKEVTTHELSVVSADVNGDVITLNV